ncbi:MAG: hypothetical protein ACRCZI_11120 [Cetobacterium sp.]
MSTLEPASDDAFAALPVQLVVDWHCFGMELNLPHGPEQMVDLVFHLQENDGLPPKLSGRMRINLATAEHLRQALEIALSRSAPSARDRH